MLPVGAAPTPTGKQLILNINAVFKQKDVQC